MTALGPQEVHEFWRNYEDPMIYRVVSFMESVEKWTIDGNPEVEKALQELGDALEGRALCECALPLENGKSASNYAGD